jgi:inorganic pyrophosphatase
VKRVASVRIWVIAFAVVLLLGVPAAGVAARVTSELNRVTGPAANEHEQEAPQPKYIDEYTLVWKRSFLEGPRKNTDGTHNVAVEIPAGTNDKWQISTTDTHVMYWEFKNGKPRVVSYLPYVGNYGSLVNSRAEDGDPLDVLVLAPAVRRGAIQKVRIIGVLKVSEPGDTPGTKVMDDKLIAVTEGTPMEAAASLADLNSSYPGVTDIVRIWFENYKGPGAMMFEGWGEAAEAQALADSVPAF